MDVGWPLPGAQRLVPQTATGWLAGWGNTPSPSTPTTIQHRGGHAPPPQLPSCLLIISPDRTVPEDLGCLEEGREGRTPLPASSSERASPPPPPDSRDYRPTTPPRAAPGFSTRQTPVTILLYWTVLTLSPLQ